MKRALALAGLLAVGLVPLTALPAAAAPVSGTGARCTIVGTKGDDVLAGTARNDVICGLGGNDVLKGGGGNDVLDGGPGTDKLVGGGGNDTLLGQAGKDTLQGGAGTDRLSGGAGADRLTGQAGDDVLAGDAGNDNVQGGVGADRLSGGMGTDQLNGQDGNDKVVGDDGNDTVAGGSGNDILLGGTGRDDLLGDAGDDDLDGGADSDDLDGGDGTNWCIVGSGDTQKACKYDRTPAEVLEVEVAPGNVDVTDSAAEVVLRAHVIDDTGVSSVNLSQVGSNRGGRMAYLASGTVRDGWWETTVDEPQYSQPGTFDVRADLYDRVGHGSFKIFPGRLTVVNRDPDTAPPVASELQVSPTSVDVRNADAIVRVTVRLTDDKSGLNLPDVLLHAQDGTGSYNNIQYAWARFDRVSGTERDGRYAATLTVPKGSTSGLWSAEIRTYDMVGNQRSYDGELLYADRSQYWSPGYVWESRLDGGTLGVTGTAVDTVAPVLTSLRVLQPVIDTLATDVTVDLDLFASDEGDGVQYVQVDVEGDGLHFQSWSALAEGSGHDGRWRVKVTFPRGTPPGQYKVMRIFVADRWHTSAYATPAPGSTESGWPTLGPDGYTTAEGMPWDGTITVVDNPAGG